MLVKTQKQKYERRAIDILISDAHCGHTQAVAPYETLGEDGIIIEANKYQQNLFKFTRSVLHDVEKLKKYDKDLLVRTVSMGDLVEGLHHNMGQLMTVDEGVMEHMGYTLIKDFVDFSDESYFIIGTETHVGRSGRMEQNISKILDKEFKGKIQKTETGSTVWWDVELDTNGKFNHYTHHGKVGMVPGPTQGNPLYKKAFTVFYERKLKGLRMFDLMAAGHGHITWDTSNTLGFTRVIQLPCIKFSDGYGKKVAPLIDPHVGIWAVIYERDGSMRVVKRMYDDWFRENGYRFVNKGAFSNS